MHTHKSTPPTHTQALVQLSVSEGRDSCLLFGTHLNKLFQWCCEAVCPLGSPEAQCPIKCLLHLKLR